MKPVSIIVRLAAPFAISSTRASRELFYDQGVQSLAKDLMVC